MGGHKSYRILLNENASNAQKRLAIELAGIIGFESYAIQFPAVVLSNIPLQETSFCYFSIKPSLDGNWYINKTSFGLELIIPEDLNSVYGICKELLVNFSNYMSTTKNAHELKEIPADYVCASDTAYPIKDFDNRKTKGLESLLEPNFILKDNDNDLLSDELNVKIAIDQVDIWETMAAANIAARLGMETLSYTYPILADSLYKGNVIKIEKSEKPEVHILHSEIKTLVLRGNGEHLYDFSSDFCNTHPNLTKGHTWYDFIESFADSLQMKNIDGQFAYLSADKDIVNEETKCYFSPSVESATGMKNLFSGVTFDSYKGLTKVYEKEYDIPWEVDVCKDIINTKLLPIINQGEDVRVEIALSEDITSRNNVKDYLCGSIAERKANLTDIKVICAYKQGFSWIDEIIVPKLKSLSTNTDSIDIYFRPFLPSGVTQWSDENGATPQITSAREDTPDKWFDLPVRYLQELYPIDDIIAKELGIDRNNVRFHCYEGKEDITYELIAKDSNGGELLNSTYKAECSERKYIDEYPGVGLVHPSTGYIRAYVNNKIVVNELIPTDLENIWNIYQTEILPYCKNYALQKSGGNPVDSVQPFFSQMRLDIEVSEPDYNLSCREDMISSINSLHEDLYFVGLDFFKIFGTRATGSNLDAPGLILPVIKKSEGKPVFKFTLLDQHYQSPRIVSGNKAVENVFKENKPNVYVSKISQLNDGLEAEITVGADVEVAKIVNEYAKLLSIGIAESNGLLSGVKKLVFKVSDGAGVSYIEANLNEYTLSDDKFIDINDIDIMEDRLIGYDDYIRIINQLKRVDGLNVYRVAESYQGRRIHAIELMPKYKGYVSRTKLINRNPVEYINGRHHANEVSATNAAFMLIKELLTNDKYKDLPEHLNLVFLPFENADGAAIHYELQKDNPNWKLHIARFNSLGKELAYEYFNKDTIHTEANGFTKTWRKWLPDVITDNHGVPSHEWDQQFSGYTSPWFKGFWMPRALLYSYFFHIKEEKYHSNLMLNKAMEDVVAESMRNDKEISGWNMDWQNRFEKYAHQWMPKLFPADYYKDMISYWIPSPYSEEHRYAAVRYPWITSVSFVSEVSDETAQGDYLKLCARAHTLHDLYVIDMLVDSKCIFKEKISNNEYSITKTYKRIRPIIK